MCFEQLLTYYSYLSLNFLINFSRISAESRGSSGSRGSCRYGRCSLGRCFFFLNNNKIRNYRYAKTIGNGR